MDSNESNEAGESLKPSKPQPSATGVITLEKAIELGEYDPGYLASFPEWHAFSRHIQWQFLKRALDNRES